MTYDLSWYNIFAGVDPGMSGGIAAIRQGDGQAWAWRYPGDIKLMADLLREVCSLGNVEMCTVEKVAAMPKQGVSSTFKFGTNYGAILGMLSVLDVPHILITPRKWQKEMLDAGTGETKERSLNMARRLFPKIDLKYKKDDGKADALHMARYALKHYGRDAA